MKATFFIDIYERKKELRKKRFAIEAYSKIKEQFNDYHKVINNPMLTKVLGETEFSLLIKFGNLNIDRINYYYKPTEKGSTFYSETYIGLVNSIF